MKKNLLLILCIMLSAVAYAQQTTEEFFTKIKNERVVSDPSVDWVNVAPAMSGYNETFVCHPTDPNVMFMGPDMHVTYGTWDNGESWHSIKDCDGNGDDFRRVIDFEFSLQNPDLGYAISLVYDNDANSGKLYKTFDKGRSWQFVKRLGKAHNELAIHPEDDQTLFIGAGDFWNVKANHKSLANPNGLLQSRADYGHVWKSTDGGVTMKKVANNISNNLDVGRIIFNPTNPDKMIMATSHGVFSSDDKGETWSASNTGLPNDLPRDLTSYYNKESGEFILYLAEQTVYEGSNGNVSSKGGIYKSTDGGASWLNITGNLGFDLTVITDYTTRELYKKNVGYWFGLSKGDFASTYPNYPSNILSVYNRIVVNPKDKDEIYLCHVKKHDKGFGPGDLWKTEDGGANWFACARNGQYWINEENKSYWQAKGNPLDANIEFAHLQHEMDDGKETQGNRHLAINLLGEVFIGVNQQTLRSNNNGESWHQIDDIELTPGSKKWISRGASNLPGLYMLHETGIPDRRLMCSGEHALWQTVDIGDYPDKDAVAVEQLEGQVNHGGAHTAKTVAVHPNNPNIIYMMATRQTHRGKIRRSTDGGLTWDNIATLFDAASGVSSSINQVQSLMCDPVNPDNMYFTSIYSELGTKNTANITMGDYGVYRSNDGGFTWNVSKPDPTDGASVRRIAMDPDNPQIIYAALNRYQVDGGLYKSTDGAVTWNQMTIPSEITSVNHVFVDRNTKYILISAGSRSGEYNAGGVWRSKDNGSTWEKIFKAPCVWQAETSPVNSDIIVVNLRGQTPSLYTEFKNPGLYLSKDAGDSWIKINRGLGNINKINQIKPDPYNESILWCAAYGSGWFKALIKTDYVKAVCNDTEIMEGEELTLFGIGSIGAQLNYEWSAPENVDLSSSNKYKTTFSAPSVTVDSTIIINLTVSNDIGNDSHEIKVKVKNNEHDTAVGDDINSNPIQIMPNPVLNGKLQVYGIVSNVNYDIVSIGGKVMLSGMLKNHLVDVSQLKSGIYILKLSDGQNHWTERFMVKY